MTEYKPLSTELCAAVRWLASECALNKTAATAGRDALLEAMPDDAFSDQDQEQMEYFWSVYDDPEMRAVITGETPDGESVQNPGWWPTYERERNAGNISGDAEPWN